MVAQRTEPVLTNLDAVSETMSKLKAKKYCKTCRGRGYNQVEYGVGYQGKRMPIVYGMAYFTQKEYCPCTKINKEN